MWWLSDADLLEWDYPIQCTWHIQWKQKNYNVATIAEETNRLNFLMSSHLYVKWILYHVFRVFFCLEPLSFTRRALFNQHQNEWLTHEITWNYNSVSKYLQPYVMISIGSHFFVLSELLRPRNNSTVFELPNIQVKDNKAELDPRKLPVRRTQEMS